MSGEKDPIPQDEIDRVVSGASSSANEPSSPFVEEAEVIPAQPTHTPQADETVTDPPPTPLGHPPQATEGHGAVHATPVNVDTALQLARLSAYVRDKVPTGEARLQDGDDVIDIVTGLLDELLIIPGNLGGSQLPSITTDEKGVLDVTVCDGVSDPGHDMPSAVSLFKRKRGGEELRATYERRT